MPVPSDAKLTCTVPVFAPAVAVSTRAVIAELLLAPPASRLTALPFVSAAPPTVPKAAFSRSVNEPAGAVLAIVRAAEAVPPTRWLARLTGFGASVPAEARL